MTTDPRPPDPPADDPRRTLRHCDPPQLWYQLTALLCENGARFPACVAQGRDT